MSLDAAIKDFESSDGYFYPLLHTNDKLEPINSRFYRPFMKSTWYSSVSEKMTIISSTDTEVVYKINPVYHYLFYSYMRFHIPKIETTSDRYQIAFTNEPSTSMVIRASLRQDNIVIQELDEYTININNHFFQTEGAGKRELIRKYSGDNDEMTNWHTMIDKQVLNVEHPWYYSTDHALAYPLLFNEEEPRTEHRYEFRRKISDLLRVRELQQDGVWRVVNLDQRHINIPIDTQIPIPELWGKYAIISDDEKMEIESECKEHYRNFWVKDFISCDPGQTCSFGATVKADIQSEYPCLAMFWSVENRNSYFSNNHSNYTAEVEDPINGFDPIIKCRLKYGNLERIIPSESDHFTISQIRHHTPSAPYKNGFHFYPFSWYPLSNQSDIAIIFDSKMKVVLECLINEKNTNEEKTEIASISGGSNMRFKLKVRLMVYKRLTITKDPKTQKWMFEINKPTK